MKPPPFDCLLLDLEGTLAAPDRRTGRAALLPGVASTLEGIRASGVRLGIASNCGEGYLEAALASLGLSRWVEEARCLASAGIRHKTDMIADLLAVFDTRSAVMVGDTRGDRDSAWANGIPHVDVGGARRRAIDPLAAEASIDGFDELVTVLAARHRALQAILERIPSDQPIALEGMPLAGKTILARDLVRLGAGRVLDDPAEVPPEAIRVHLVCDEDVLIRRARGLGLGVAPVDDLVHERLPAYDRAAMERADVVVDATNPIQLELR